MRHTGQIPLTLLIIISSVRSQSGTYTIIAPRTLHPNSLYNVGVSVEAEAPVQAVVSIRSRHLSGGSSGLTQQATIDPRSTSSQLITLQVGDLVDGGSYNLVVRGTGGLNFENTTELIYSPKASSILIQTDKSVYGVGDLVQFRVLYLDRSLRPKGLGTLDVFAKDSQGSVIKQWKNVVASRGVFSEKLQLSSHPTLGDWTVEVHAQNQKEVQSFLIVEYVRPKFNVDLSLPSHAIFSDSKIIVRVRATQTYGMPVKGELVVSAFPIFHSTFLQPVFPGIARKTLQINGNAEVEYDFARELQLSDDYQRMVQVEAMITETGTGRKQNATATITLHKYPYKLKILEGSTSFKPGLPYSAVIKASTHEGVPISDSRTDALQVKHGFSNNHDEFQLSTYAIPSNGLVSLSFEAPKNESLLVLGIEAGYKDLTQWFPVVQKALARSGAYIEAVIKTPNPKVNTEIEVEVTSTVPFDTLNYHLLGRGDLLLSRKLTNRSPSTKLNFRVLTPINSSPKATLIVHVIHDGEVIADGVEFEVAGLLDNVLDISTSSNQVEPGREVEISTLSKPNSFIGLRGVDQASLMNGDRDVNLAFVEKELGTWNGAVPKEKAGRTSTASAVFQNAGLVVLSNAVVYQQRQTGLATSDDRANPRPVRPFYDYSAATSSIRPDIGPAIPYDGPTRPPLAGPYAWSKIPRPKLSRYRVFLSDDNQVPGPTWIFNRSVAGYDGRSAIKVAVPDALMSWVVSGFALDNVYGLSLSTNPSPVKAFRPFFISLNVPKTVVRGEAVGVQVLVHNNMDRGVTADLTLDNSAYEYTFSQGENDIETRGDLFKTQKVNVQPNSVESLTFLITPTKLGAIDLKVKAESRLAGDSITRILQVVAPGQPQVFNQAIMIDSRRPPIAPLNLTIPTLPKRVNGSDWVKFSVVGDVLGPALTNLDQLLDMPTGCGEQNMVKFVPNAVVLDYLQTTRQASDATHAKAVGFLEAGYQRQLSYRHDDGSFSAFGPLNSPTGSTFLTAYVVRGFLAAKPHIFIDKRVIEAAVDWLVSQQEANGRFKEVGRIYNTDLPGQASKGLALSAYVTLALLEAESDPDIRTDSKFSIAKNVALDFLNKNLEGSTDPYAVSIIAFVLNRADHYSKQGAFNILESLAKISADGQYKHWEPVKVAENSSNLLSNQTTPLSVEATAYALLCYSQRNYVGDSIPVVRWLLQQRNPNGGFLSSQDTVVALTALSRFARLSRTSSTDMTVDITHEGGSQRFEVKDKNAIMLQELVLPVTTHWVTIEYSGTGVAMAQLSWGYNVPVTAAWPAFTLDPQIDRTSNTNQLTLSVCTSYYGGNVSNMAVMEVEMPTGFAINRDRLPNLLHYPSIKRYETDDADSKVVMYFDSLENRKENCPTIQGHRVFPVAMQAPSAVTIYDYYDTTKKARQFYSGPKATICDICDVGSCPQDCLAAEKLRQSEESARVNRASSVLITIPNILLVAIILFTIPLYRC